jgi:diguanylate cyclase (GGDEF)-like protein/PAS domain S-box-containing protein
VTNKKDTRPRPLSARKITSRLVEPYVLFPLLAIVLLGVIWGTTASLVAAERASAEREASSASRGLVESYEAQVLRALREIDQALRIVQFAHERGGGRVDLAALKARGLLLPDLFFIVSLTDARGRVVAATRGGDLQDMSAQGHFRASRDLDILGVGRPVEVPGGEPRLHFSRRLASGGGFAGAVVVSVPASYFTSGYEESRLGREGVLALLGNDGVFRIRRTGEALGFGERVDYQPFLVATDGSIDASPRASANPWDGVRRFTSSRELFDFPLAVVVGLSEDEHLAAARAAATTYRWRAAGGSVALILMLGGLGWLGWKLARARVQASRVLQAIESSVNAIVITDLKRPGTPIDYANPAFEKITGYSAAEALGRDTSFLLGADTEQPGIEELRRARAERREGQAVVRSYRKDGSLFWNELTIAPVRDERGEVTHFVEVMNDVTEAKNYEAELARQANFDALTGLANRNLLKDRLTHAIAAARREGGSLAAIMLDLDNFKVVNDSLGHHVGDELLQLVAARLKACVRSSDTVARLGGDEFLLVTRASGQGRAESESTALVSKVLDAICQPVVVGGRSMRITASVGVSLYPQDGYDEDTVLQHADAAMYRAKELGRNRFQFFTADVHERIQRRLELHTSLRLAIEREEFELHYQPQVGLRDGEIVAVEALLRWRHPQKGLVPPSHFVGFAEETGLIVPIGKWVLNEACRRNKAWQDAGLPKVPIAVNMSAKQCEQSDVDQVVREALEASGLEARYLELEITESVSMADPQASVPLMQRLKATGVTLSIDDFGTGFSNLSYLPRFPVDRLKIDLSFVREIARDPGSLAVSEAIINMSHSLNLQVVAEGVETQRQLELLQARNCDTIQGFYFSPPLTHERLAGLLGEGRRLSYPRSPGVHDAPALVQ